MKAITIYFLAWCFSTVCYLLAIKDIKKKYNKRLEERTSLLRKVDLWEQHQQLLYLKDIQESQPNVSKGDTEMMNMINYYIENTASELRNLGNKNEPSKGDKNG